MPASQQRLPSEVHVWSYQVGQRDDPTSGLALLDDAERARANRFRFERDRVRFVSRHAFVRRVLSRYLDVEPVTIDIRRSARGKPELEPSCGISFNTSHAGDMAVVAVTSEGCVGVDIERLRHIQDAMVVATEHFTDSEVEVLRAAPRSTRSRLFLELWTRKESFVKALGRGLSIPLDGFTVLGPGDADTGRPYSPTGPLPYSFKQLDEPRGYVGAVTLAGSQIAVCHMRCTSAA